MQALQDLDADALGEVLRHARCEHCLPCTTAQVVENESSLWVDLAQHAIEGVVLDLAVD